MLQQTQAPAVKPRLNTYAATFSLRFRRDGAEWQSGYQTTIHAHSIAQAQAQLEAAYRHREVRINELRRIAATEA